MTRTNTRLVVLVSAVAVAAVVVGGVVANRRAPEPGDGGAASPLSARSGSVGTDGPQYTGPVKVRLPLGKLKRGRDPQVPHSVGRQVRGGAGGAITIPGTAPVLEFSRMGDAVFAVLSEGDGASTVLLKLKSTGDRQRVPDVLTVRATEDQSAVAYATQPRNKDGTNRRGGVVFAETVDGMVRRLEVPGQYDVRVLAYVGGAVYFRGSAGFDAGSWKLFRWVPGQSRAQQIPTHGSATAISSDGELVALRTAAGEHRTCATVNELATGRSLWRTCDHEIKSFTPDGRTAIAGPAYADGWAASSASVLDVTDGTLLRQWTGASFVASQAEDDQHVLLLIDDKESMPRGVLRCAVPTGACELAVPLGGIRVGLGT